MALIEPDVAADSPVFPDEEWTEAVAIVDLLDTEITARNPIMSRRYGFFQSQMSRTQTFSQYLAHLRDIGNFCDLESLTPNGIVIFIAITTMCPEYEDLLDDDLSDDLADELSESEFESESDSEMGPESEQDPEVEE
mgnify:CR=1 FL=1